MKAGAAIPSPGVFTIEPGPGERARLAEAAGADSLWVNDHLVQVESSRSRYPFSRDGKLTWPPDLPHWESLTTLAFVAAHTERATIGTAVLVLPQRHVVQLAKTTATLDVLSGGRLVLGCGLGWLAEEMEACGWSFESRGARADEMLSSLRSCWAGRPGAVSGEHVKLPPDLVFEPAPVQKPGPPILIGGMSPAALRRAARHGDGWLAIAMMETLQIDELRRTLENVLSEREQSERREEPFRAAIHLHSAAHEVGLVPKAASKLQAIGFDEVIVDPPWLNTRAATRMIAAVRNAVGDADASALA